MKRVESRSSGGRAEVELSQLVERGRGGRALGLAVAVALALLGALAVPLPFALALLGALGLFQANDEILHAKRGRQDPATRRLLR